MTGDVVIFPRVKIGHGDEPPIRPGNGAREALIDMEPLPSGGDLIWADWVLTGLWLRGFKVVRLEASDYEL